MKKTLSAFLLILILFAGCSSDSDSDSDFETANNFTNKDTSNEKNSFYPSLMPDLSWENECLKSTCTNANESTNRGFCYSDGKSMYGCGFEGKIKFNDQVKFAGFQIFKKSSPKYDRFDFLIKEDSSFEMKSRINEVSKTIFTLSSNESHLDAANFNTIKVRTTDFGNVEIYINGYLVKKLLKPEMAFSLTESDKLTFCYNTKSTASSSKKAEIWAKVLSVQNKR